VLATAIQRHLAAARDAAIVESLNPVMRLRLFRNTSRIERVTSNLDAAEILLLNLVPSEYLLGQIPTLLRHVQRHLPAEDPRRQDFERIAGTLRNRELDRQQVNDAEAAGLADAVSIVTKERQRIIAIVRAALSAALRESLRLRSLVHVVVISTTATALLAIGFSITAFFNPTLIPLCFDPQEAGVTTVVCPTNQSQRFVPAGWPPQGDVPFRDTEDVIEETVTSADVAVVALAGLTAGAVAAAATVRRLKGSADAYGLPLALAGLKLPTGAITAVLGLLLMRGQFIPGLTALDTSGQIIAWALVFGYSQQLFTRLVDQQASQIVGDLPSPPRQTALPRTARSLEQLRHAVAADVDHAVQEALAPPRVVNVEGRLFATWVRTAKGAWNIGVTVRTGPEAREASSAEGRPFRVTGGYRQPETVLEIAVDLPGHVVQVGDTEVTIATEGGRRTWVGVAEPEVTEPRDAWVALYTGGRFLQAVPVNSARVT
jgi:hypothetical protein